MIENINPLDWYNVRFLDYIPPHFVKMKFRHDHARAEVLHWLQTNTTGRLAIASETNLNVGDDDSNLKYFNFGRVFSDDMYIAFEEPADATMYTMFYK